jgi:hypothetical protein
MQLTGRNQLARRFIHAPVFEWQPVAGASRYRVTTAQESRTLAVLESDRPAIDFSPLWPDVAEGQCRWLIQALDGEHRQVAHSQTYSFTRARAFSDGQPAPRADYAAAVGRNVEFLLSDTGVGNYAPALPPYIWHCAIDSDTNSVSEPRRRNRAFPAIHFPAMIDGLLDAYRHSGDAALLARARQIADWTIEHSTPAAHRYPYLPYQCVSEGRLGLHGGKPIEAPGQDDASLVEPNKCGYVGTAYLRIFRETGIPLYLEVAERIADTLLSTQQPGGNWLYRVDSRTGQSHGEDYTSAIHFALTFIDELNRISPDGSYRAAKDAALRWLLDNPLATFRWENMFDDTSYLPNYTNTANYDTLFVGRYLLARRHEDARFLPLAEEIFRWVDDNFVLYGPDPWLPYVPHTPTVTEQWQYYWPMAGHTANWLLFLLPLYSATGADEYLQRAVGAANVLTHCVLADGRSATYVPDAVLGVRGAPGTEEWFGDTFWSISALIAMLEQG